jgi:hypothetical protein
MFPESVSLLQGRVPGLSEADAFEAAEAMGDLPLAIAQAAGYMARTGMPADEYRALLSGRTAEILPEGRPVSYPRTLAAVTQIALEELRSEEPAAAGAVRP